jgi:hypothetical protein
VLPGDVDVHRSVLGRLAVMEVHHFDNALQFNVFENAPVGRLAVDFAFARNGVAVRGDVGPEEQFPERVLYLISVVRLLPKLLNVRSDVGVRENSKQR